MSSIYEIYSWQILIRSDGALYVSGYLYSGKAWETSTIINMWKREGYYAVETRNSIYHLV